MPSKQKSKTMSDFRFWSTTGLLSFGSVIGGLIAGFQPDGAGWRFFSYHPLLMTAGFVGMMGNAAIIKKLGGYSNTKLHGNLAMGGLFLALGGFYVIYKNKENSGKDHFTSNHSIAGLTTLIGSTTVGLAGSILLNPDFGIAKTNKLFRSVHKFGARLIIALGWFTCYSGLSQLTSNYAVIGLYMLPLILATPFTLV